MGKGSSEDTVEYFVGLEEDNVKTLAIDKIDLEKNEFEFRLTTRVGDLMESIQANGQQFPVVVRVIPDTTPKKYQLISGFRRVRALNKLAIPEVKAIVRDLDDDTAYKISFMENEKRKNLTGVDKAHAIAKLRVKDKSTEDICEIYGIGEKQLTRYEKVGKFPKNLQDAIGEERIQTSHGLLLAQARERHGEQVKFGEWIKRIENEELTVRQLQRALNLEYGRPKKKARYIEKQKGGFRLYPMRFDPKNTDADAKAKMIDVLRDALQMLEGIVEVNSPKAAKPVSQGKCELCGKTVSRTAMTQHLKGCTSSPVAVRKGRSFHLFVGQRGDKTYWLHLAVPVDAPLAVLDRFLRDTWLECCGHMSAFEIGGRQYSSSPSDEYDEAGMDVPLEEVVVPGAIFRHEYDFGSTTELEVKVVGVRDHGTPGGRPLLLARNDPPEITCQTCGKAPAVFVCGECAWNSDGWLCRKCAKKHECGDEMLLPVVNSPRVGVCGYAG